jgi:hypothetical protein
VLLLRGSGSGSSSLSLRLGLSLCLRLRLKLTMLAYMVIWVLLMVTLGPLARVLLLVREDVLH